MTPKDKSRPRGSGSHDGPGKSSNSDGSSPTNRRQAAVNFALACIQLGWPVLPLNTIKGGDCTCPSGSDCRSPGKHPIGNLAPHGSRSATTDEDQVREWWRIRPDANVGVATGKASGIIVLDVDPRNGGNDSLKQLVKEHGKLPKTIVVETGGGGRHYYYRDKNVASHTPAPGVDVKGDGGFVVAPPSLHESGKRYKWLRPPRSRDLRLPDPPAWIVKKSRKRRDSGGADASGPIVEGQRDNALTRIAGWLRRNGSSEQTILDYLKRENEERCIPPLDEADLERIAHSVAGYDPDPDFEKIPMNPLGLAKRLVVRHGRDLLYVHPWKSWLIWDGARWMKDDLLKVGRLAIDTVEAIGQEALAEEEDDEQLRILKFANSAQSRNGYDSMLHLARPMLSAYPAKFDTDPWTLNVVNGTIDLRTGELHEHRREDFNTRLAPVEYNPKAKCPRWLKFLDEVYDGDEELIDWMQRSYGYAITGDMSQEVYWMLYGEGRNGKGIQLRTIKGILGDYATSTPFSTFETIRKSIRDDLADLQGRRFVIASESGEASRIDTSTLKAITGRDHLQARKLYVNLAEFRPEMKIFLAVNEKPRVGDMTMSFWERTRSIPHERQFVGKKQDKNLEKTLEAEWSGILRWLVEGCLRYQKEGLEPAPQKVIVSGLEYREDNDPLARFINETLTASSALRISNAAAWKTYQDWAKESLLSKEQLTRRAFSQEMARKFKRITPRGLVYYLGVGVANIEIGKG